MPMKKISTPLTITTSSEITGKESSAKTGPKKSTVSFLRQFARCYSPEPVLAIPSLRGAVMN